MLFYGRHCKRVDRKGTAMKVASLFGLLDQLKSDKITVDQDRCVLVRNRNADCLRCAKACPSGCISFDEEAAEVVISPEKCIGCGTCASVCPTEALAATNPTDAELLRSVAQAGLANDGEPIAACEQFLARAEGRYDAAKVVSVPCLGRVDESLLLSLAAMGFSKITLVHGPCAECHYATGFAACSEAVETARTLLDLWKSPVVVRISAKLPGSARLADEAEGPAYDESRRSFLTDARDGAVRVASAATNVAVKDWLGEEEPEPMRWAKVGDDGTLAHHVPIRRKRLLAALERLGEPADEMLGSRLWGHVVIDPDKCTSCQMCAVFCPTGALRKFQDADGTFGVSHGPSACVKCRTCEEICPADAISISDEVFAVDLLQDEVERYPMRPREMALNDPHQIHDHMKKILGGGAIYER